MPTEGGRRGHPDDSNGERQRPEGHQDERRIDEQKQRLRQEPFACEEIERTVEDNSPGGECQQNRQTLDDKGGRYESADGHEDGWSHRRPAVAKAFPVLEELGPAASEYPRQVEEGHGEDDEEKRRQHKIARGAHQPCAKIRCEVNRIEKRSQRRLSALPSSRHIQIQEGESNRPPRRSDNGKPCHQPPRYPLRIVVAVEAQLTLIGVP